MRFLVSFIVCVVVLDVICALPFPFELGGDRDDDEDVYYRPQPVRGWRYYRPQHRSMYRSPGYGRFRNANKPTDNDDEDEKNREKVEQALAAQQTVIESVMPVLHSIIPSTTNFFSGVMPRMRRSHGSIGVPPEETLDQLSVPSETSVSLILPTKQMSESASSETVAPSVVLPVSYQQAAQSSIPIAIPLFASEKEGRENNNDERNDDDSGDDDGEESAKEFPVQRALARAFPSPSFPAQVISPAFLPRAPEATITTGDDDKIYFAVDRKTILAFLSALFGADMRSALTAAMHENSVHKP